MKKTYTKIILGIVTFLWTLFGPISLIAKPIIQHADRFDIDESLGFSNSYTSVVATGSTVTSPTATGAPNTTTTPGSTNDELAVALESILKVLYVLLRPALFIAGLAMDNSLVYGEIFGLDRALFQFWQIMKNFANFALGFVFVWSVLKYIFDIKSGKATNPKDLIVKLLIAAIGINTSRFIMGALIDISTALTVGIGGLPIQFMGDTDIANKPLFGTVTSIKLNNAIGKRDTTPVFHTWPGAKFPAPQEYLLPCYYDANTYQWGTGRRDAFGVSDVGGTATGTQIGFNQVVQDFCIAGNNVVGKKQYQDSGSPNVNDITLMKPIYVDSLKAFQDLSQCGPNSACQTIRSFSKKTEGYQGAFYSLYASLMNLSTIHIGVPKSQVSLTMEMLIKLLVALAYLIPLIILAVVLIMRVGYLWLIIAFSPFIVLASVKEIGGKIGDKMSNETLKKIFDIKKVISLLLLPVVVTFVLSLSIVFLGSLSEGLTKNGTAESMGIYQTVQGSYKCYDVAITNICLDMPTRDVGLGIGDYFSWSILNLFGVALMWFAVMAALKSSAFTEKIAGTLQTIGSDMLMGANFIPIPGSDNKTNLSAIGNIGNDIKQRLSTSKTESQQIFSEAMAGVGGDIMGKDKKVNEAITRTQNALETIKNDPKVTDKVSKQKETLRNNIKSGDFDAQGSMNFGQADNALGFANYLAAGTPGLEKHKFSTGQDLFTTDEGRKVLKHWFDDADEKTRTGLKNMYSSKIYANDWDKQKAEIDKILTPPAQLLALGTKKEDFIYKDGKKILLGTIPPSIRQEDIHNIVKNINDEYQKDNTLDISTIINKNITIGSNTYTITWEGTGTNKKLVEKKIMQQPTTPQSSLAGNPGAGPSQTPNTRQPQQQGPQQQTQNPPQSSNNTTQLPPPSTT